MLAVPIMIWIRRCVFLVNTQGIERGCGTLTTFFDLALQTCEIALSQGYPDVKKFLL
jgi:hypothetical protein